MFSTDVFRTEQRFPGRGFGKCEFAPPFAMTGTVYPVVAYREGRPANPSAFTILDSTNTG